MAQTVQRSGQVSSNGAPRQTPGITAVGWLLICFAVIPILYGVHQFSRSTLVAGVAVAAVGVVCVLIGRLRLHRQSAG